MATTKSARKRSKPSAQLIDQAYGAARDLLCRKAELFALARYFQAAHTLAKQAELAHAYARTFICWLDLCKFLDTHMTVLAREAHARGCDPVRVGNGKPYCSVIELVQALGLSVRNMVYESRSHPLEPDISRLMKQAQEKHGRQSRRRQSHGTKPPMGWGEQLRRLIQLETSDLIRHRLGLHTVSDVEKLISKDWTALGRERIGVRVRQMQGSVVDFDLLLAQLEMEFRAVNQVQGRRDANLPSSAEGVPVLAAVAAGIAGTRVDTLLRSARRRRYSIHGARGGLSVGLNCLIAMYPEKARAFRSWAERELAQ